MPVSTMTEESCDSVDQLWLKGGLTKELPMYVPVSGPRWVGIPSSQLQIMCVTGSVEFPYGNLGKPNVLKSLDRRTVAPLSASCVNDTQKSCEQTGASLYEHMQCGVAEGIMYLEERSRVHGMLEERGELVDVLREMSTPAQTPCKNEAHVDYKLIVAHVRGPLWPRCSVFVHVPQNRVRLSQYMWKLHSLSLFCSSSFCTIST